MRSCPTLLALACGVLLAHAAAAAPRPAHREWFEPRLHLSWNAPWGEPGAVRNIETGCADTLRSDTLYLTFTTPGHTLPLQGLSGVLVFEPQEGDTLGPFWWFERGGPNGGNLQIDFDLVSGSCLNPWKVLVAGRVGYGHAGSRGRLDLSADVPPKQVQNLSLNQCFYFAQVTFLSRQGGLPGCRRPMRIRWNGGRIRTTRPGLEELILASGPDQSVTWNAPRGGIVRRGTRLAMDAWMPRFAPPSWSAMALLRNPPPPAAAPIEVEK